jgi:hypothetical protein
MQAPGSFALVATFIGVAALSIALSVIIGAPILAVPFILAGFGAFLVWRGKQRAGTSAGRYTRARASVPSTQETAADPAGDSGVAEAARSGSTSSHRADASEV